MFNSRIFSACAALLLALPTLAQAEGKAALTYGYDQNGYRSFAFKGDIDFTKDYILDIDHLHAESSGIVSMRQSGIGLTAYATDWLSGHYRYSETNDTVFLVAGNEGDISVALNALWDSKLKTKLTGGYASFAYNNANPPANGGGRTLDQTRRSYSLSQDITPTFNLYASYDEYAYEVDLTRLVLLLVRRSRIAAISANSFLSFPDTTRSVGFTWKTTEKLTFDISSSKALTVFNQDQINSRLGFDYQLTDALNIGLAVTRSTSTSLIRASGVVVQPASDTTLNEVTASWYF
jgi:hypothetical protein